MPPELLMDGTLTKAADVYAFGKPATYDSCPSMMPSLECPWSVELHSQGVLILM